MRSVRLLGPAVLLAACTAIDDDPDQGVHVLMDVSPGAGFWDAPFPSAHRLVDGTVDMSGFPRQSPTVDFVDSVLGLAEQMTGFGTTSGIFFRLERGIEELNLPPASRIRDPRSPVFLLGIDGPDAGLRVPVDARYQVTAGPYGGLDMLSLLPIQGRPLHPGALYAAVVRRDLNDWTGEPLAALDVETLLVSDAPWTDAYRTALSFLDDFGTAAGAIAGLAVFRTQDPVAEQRALVAAAREEGLRTAVPLAFDAAYDDYCVYRGDLEVPVFQGGEPPFLSSGGAIVWEDGRPVLQGREPSRIYVTIPRVDEPADGWPTAVFIRTGGGGDLPLMNRGVRDADGVAEAGTGIARDLARIGWAGVQIDGPHGGPRNVSEGDEQFLMFNVTNPPAMRDNVRQSAVELGLLPDLIEDLTIPTDGCPDGTTHGFDVSRLALIGHSMGATIAPVVLSTEPRYRAAVLSGAGGSWIHNVVHKLSPLETRPLAESILRYEETGARLTEHDPILSMLQWVGESADPPVHAAAMARVSAGGGDRDAGGLPDVLMFQGIVDTYILPPIANALSASLALDLAGEALDVTAEWPGDYRTYAQVQALAEFTSFPGGVGLLSQHLEDGVEDGHEVMFQLAAPKARIQTFLSEITRD